MSTRSSFMRQVQTCNHHGLGFSRVGFWGLGFKVSGLEFGDLGFRV